MSFGFSKRIKKLFGVLDEPMNDASWMEGATYENTGKDSGFSNRDLANQPDTRARSQQEVSAFEERQQAALAARDRDQSTVRPTQNEGSGVSADKGAWSPSGGGRRNKFT